MCPRSRRHGLRAYARSDRLRQKVLLQEPRRFDVPVEDIVIHPNWRPMKSATHWRNCVKYIAKQDEENADLLVEDPKTMSNVESAKPYGEYLVM